MGITVSKRRPDIRTFGALIAHISDSQMRTCSAVKGEQKQADGRVQDAKADLVAALKASFDECDAAWDSITDANAGEALAGRGQRSKLGALIGNTIHSNEEYGYLAVLHAPQGCGARPRAKPVRPCNSRAPPYFAYQSRSRTSMPVPARASGVMLYGSFIEAIVPLRYNDLPSDAPDTCRQRIAPAVHPAVTKAAHCGHNRQPPHTIAS